MTSNEVISYLEECGHFDSARVYLDAPGGTITDEDSADEDEGGTINNLPGNQLRAGAHARIFSNAAETMEIVGDEDHSATSSEVDNTETSEDCQSTTCHNSSAEDDPSNVIVRKVHLTL